MFEDAVTYGIVDPIVTTAGRWSGRAEPVVSAESARGQDPRRARTALTICTLLALGLYAAVWVADAVSVQRTIDLAAKITLAVLALLTVRCAVQDRVAAGGTRSGRRRTGVVRALPEGGAGRAVLRCLRGGRGASSRSSRRLRRESPPVLDESFG